MEVGWGVQSHIRIKPTAVEVKDVLSWGFDNLSLKFGLGSIAKMPPMYHLHFSQTTIYA